MPEAPQRRGDVISSILSDYGGTYDDEEKVSPFVISPMALPAPQMEKALPSPRVTKDKALPDKPLPPIMAGFQLRATPPRRPRDTTADDDNGQQEPLGTPTSIVLPRSIERKKGKPPSLKLRITNGSTAGSVTHSASSSTASNSSVSTLDSTSSFNTRALSDRPLPRLPPPPPARSVLRTQPVEMGNKASKASVDREASTDSRPPSPPMKHVRRKMVPGGASRPTLADTISSTRGRTRTRATDGSADTIIPSGRSSEAPSVPSNAASTKESESKPPSETSTQSDQTTIVRKADSDSTSMTESETSLEEVPQPATPPTKLQPVLPSPSPMPEESPSKYGLRQPGAYMDTPPVSDNGKAKKLGHAKGKSSTSFDLFRKDATSKSASNLSDAQAYLQTITPSPSPATADFSHVRPAVGHADETRSEQAVTTARRISDASLEKSPSSAVLPSGQKYAVTPNALRPATTNAPYLNVLHMGCYWQHRRFLPSRTTINPVACMLCYGSDSPEWWSCCWCSLRICKECRIGLERCPSRSIEAYVEQKQARLEYGEEDDEIDNSKLPVLIESFADEDVAVD